VQRVTVRPGSRAIRTQRIGSRTSSARARAKGMRTVRLSTEHARCASARTFASPSVSSTVIAPRARAATRADGASMPGRGLVFRRAAAFPSPARCSPRASAAARWGAPPPANVRGSRGVAPRNSPRPRAARSPAVTGASPRSRAPDSRRRAAQTFRKAGARASRAARGGRRALVVSWTPRATRSARYSASTPSAALLSRSDRRGAQSAPLLAAHFPSRHTALKARHG
jgi:hypothetical protein